MPPLLHLTQGFGLSVGSTQLLELDSSGAEVLLVSGQRVALVGPNGCGKTTLLKALWAAMNSPNEEREDSYYMINAGGIRGSLIELETHDRHSCRVVLVQQDALQWTQLLGIEDMSEEEVRELTISEALETAVAEGFDPEIAMRDEDHWRRISIAAADALQWNTSNYSSTVIGCLSPGSAVRAFLTIALGRPGVELLLLDEPTNHLDLPSIIWLQECLRASQKSALIVSHDSEFLDAVCDHLWVVDAFSKTLSVSGASYSAFRHAEQVAREQQAAAYETQQRRNQRLTAVANQLRASSTAGSQHIASDKDKLQRDFRRDRAGRSGKKAKAVEKYRDSQPEVSRPDEHKALRIEIHPLPAGSDSSIILNDVVLGYPEASVTLPVPSISLRIEFGERIALVGYNGVGKSTLLRTLTGNLEPIGGDAVVGRELRIGNLTQEHESLPRDESARDHFASVTGRTRFDSAKRLINYGLTLAQVDIPMQSLNPGARARALLAIFAERSVNVLVLDEPTNHLDEEAIAEVLATVNECMGTVLLVSHNRDFLRALERTRILQLAGDGLTELESIDELLSDIEDRVASVVAASQW